MLTLMKAAVCGLMSAPWRVVREMMKRAQPVLVFNPIPLFTRAHSFGTYAVHTYVNTVATCEFWHCHNKPAYWQAGKQAGIACMRMLTWQVSVSSLAQHMVHALSLSRCKLAKLKAAAVAHHVIKGFAIGIASTQIQGIIHW